MSCQLTPESARAARAAARPYSTKLRPHLPQGCMPAPRTAMSLLTHRPPVPHEVVGLVVGVEDADDEFDLLTDTQVGQGPSGRDLAEDDELLGLQFDGGDHVGHERVG